MTQRESSSWLWWAGCFAGGALCPPVAVLGVTLLLLLRGLSDRAQPPAGASLLGALLGTFIWKLVAEAIPYWVPLIGGG